jgi:hypothetical protein
MLRSQSLELVTSMILLGIKLREPLAHNAIDLIGLLKLSPVGRWQPLHENRQIVRTRGRNASYVEGVVR